MQFLLDACDWRAKRGGGKKRISVFDAGNKAAEGVEIKRVTKLSEYVEIISNESSSNSQDLILFRGQRLANWTLVPKIGRKETRLKAKENTPPITVEKAIFDSFKRLSLPFLAKAPDTALESLAVAQHHGLPTRLLDWTSNALAALWFAVRNASEPNSDAAVWILNPSDSEFIDDDASCDPFDINEILVYRPRHLNTRIIAQSGYFTVHPLIPRSVPRVHRYVAVEHELTLNHRLKKIEIPQSSFSSLRDNLERHGVSDLTMFPDLEGVARFIEWNHSFMADESCPGEVLLFPEN